MNENIERFPRNIYKPYSINVDGEDYSCYSAKFNSLYDLYNYLKSNPKINSEVFKSLSSETGEEDFAGVPYSEAVEELIKPPREEYKDFLKLSKGLNVDNLEYGMEYIDVKGPGGGVIDVPSFVTGSPLCYKTSRSIYVPKFVILNVALSYRFSTTKSQVLNRALIISSLISAFENAGYMVKVNTFELSSKEDELIYINVNIKNNDETLNKSSLYKSLCYVEFLRRLLFRVLETLSVTNGWYYGYGHTCDEDFVRSALKFDKNDIYIGEPQEMDISGKDIYRDFINVVDLLELDDMIDVKRFKSDFEKNIMILKRGIK